MQMELEIISTEENRPLNRKKVRFKSRNRKRGDIRSDIAKALKVPETNIVIDNMKTQFGKDEVMGYAKIYGDQESMREIEREHIITRNFGKEEEAK